MLVLDLFLRRGPFWGAVQQVRRRWQIEPSTGVPPLEFDDSIYPMPEATEWENDQWVRWHNDVGYLRSQALPHVSSRPLDDTFFAASILYDPPDNALLEYADRFPLGATLLASDAVRVGFTKNEVLSMPHMTSPPIKRLCNPYRLLAIEREFTHELLQEVNERHLKPKGLNLESMVDDVLQRTPLLREYLEKQMREQQEARLYIEVEPHTTGDDVQRAFSMIAATQPQRPRKGRPPVDELVAVQCAVLYDRYNQRDQADRRRRKWAYKRLSEEFREFGVTSEASAKQHVERGRELLNGN
jgi:hypothetical protein